MIVYLDGKFVPEAEAVVSVFDRCFLYGDGLFEAIRLYQGKPFGWNQHLVQIFNMLIFHLKVLVAQRHLTFSKYGRHSSYLFYVYSLPTTSRHLSVWKPFSVEYKFWITVGATLIADSFLVPSLSMQPYLHSNYLLWL